jgi:hypothetical protein
MKNICVRLGSTILAVVSVLQQAAINSLELSSHGEGNERNKTVTQSTQGMMPSDVKNCVISRSWLEILIFWTLMSCQVGKLGCINHHKGLVQHLQIV